MIKEIMVYLPWLPDSEIIDFTTSWKQNPTID